MMRVPFMYGPTPFIASFYLFSLSCLLAENNATPIGGLKSPSSASQQSTPSLPKGNNDFIISSFIFKGHTIFSSKKLSSHVSHYLERNLSFDDLHEISEQIEMLYEENGFLARVFVPPQEIKDGKVHIEIVEGKFGSVLFAPTGSSNVKESIISSIMEDGLESGQVYQAGDFERKLLIADDLPGVSLTGFLQSSEKSGHVDLMLKTSKEPAYIADLAVDNANSSSLGEEKISFSGMLVSPLKRGETISLQTLKSEGTRYGRLSLGMPLGSLGWRLNLNASRMNYLVIAPELRSLDISGKVREQGINLRYPIIRGRKGNLFTSISFDNRKYLTTVAGISQKDYTIDNGKIEFSANYFDNIIKAGANSSSLSFTHGKVSGFGVDQNYHTILNYSLSRQQSVTNKLSVYLSFEGQHGLHLPSSNAQEISGVSSQDYLDSAENFSLGGLNGVRAYPSGEASGPQGQRLTAELRYLLHKNLTVKPFYDWGMVEKRDPTSLGPSKYEISGAGLSASLSAPLGFSLQTTYARRIGENPNSLPSGFDQDGTLREDRIWVVVARSF